MRRARHLRPNCRGRPGLRLSRVAECDADPGTLEAKNSGDKQHRRIGYSEGLPMLNVSFTVLLLFTYS